MNIKTQRKPLGLTDAEAELSRQAHGSNHLPVLKRKSLLTVFLQNLSDPVIRILLFALACNVLMNILGISNGDKWEALGIAFSIVLSTMISTLSEHRSECAFARLSEENAVSLCRVRRNGSIRQIEISEIVVGDVVLLSAGDGIPADGEILSGTIACDQSTLTGESREVKKKPAGGTQGSGFVRDPASTSSLFRGCTVLQGECEMRVTEVGKDTFLGEISREVQEETRKSPLKLRLERLAKQISVLGYVASGIVAFAYLFNVIAVDSAFDPVLIRLKLLDLPFVLSTLIHAFTLALTVIVVAVPEGLPLMVAVVLSSNIRKMIRDRVLVRKPAGIEAAGSMNLLFTDKTGTLTEGKLSCGELFLADGKSYQSVQKLKAKHAVYREFLYSSIVNTSSLPTETKGNGSTLAAVGGNATDSALLTSILRCEHHLPAFERTFYLPFDSTRKYSVATAKKERGITTYVKGAPEKLLPFVRYALTEDGKQIPFAPYRSAFEKEIRTRTERGVRVLLLAECDGLLSKEDAENGSFGSLTVLLAVTLSDKIRPEAPKSVSSLRRAGIHVVMITGDNRETAASIAEKCGILKDGIDTVLTGEELTKLSDTRLKELLPRIGVVARALPGDKSRLVALAQEIGLVVGMTGDGINDAPALKRADIGFSMGSGTQVARDAGDIIILDNNLASIVNAVLYGRTIFKSIRKFITLQLTMNFSAVGVTMICPFLGIESPVTVVQMLWINVIMDTLGGLAFAGEAPQKRYMREKPKRRDEPILNGYMVHQISFLSIFTVALSLAFLKSPRIIACFRSHENDLCLLTAFFAFFIFTSIFQCFNCRSDRLSLLQGIGQNATFLPIMLLIAVLQICFIYLGGRVLRTMPLLPKELYRVFFLSLLVFPADFIRKLLWRLSGHHHGF